MPRAARRTRPLPKIRITIDLDGTDRERWRLHALKLGVSIEEMIAAEVEAAIVERSSIERGCAPWERVGRST